MNDPKPAPDELAIETMELKASLQQAVELLMGWQALAAQFQIVGTIPTRTALLFVSNTAFAEALVDIHADHNQQRSQQ